MVDMYKKSGNITPQMRKTIHEVVKCCQTCQMKKKSQPRPRLSMMKAKNPNDIVTLDLKQFIVRGKSHHLLWMIDSFSRLSVGKVLKSKESKEVVGAIESGWIFNWGCPSTGFWADNGTEFQNAEMNDLCERWKISIKFGAPYSPWSNGTNERNHASCDIVVSKIHHENKESSLQEAVTKAHWTHNTNISRQGFVPLQIMTGKAISYPGLEARTEEKEVSEHIQ